MKCMLLAAGLGTRLRPVTLKIPKPAVELLNVPLFNYSVELLKTLKPEQVVVNAHLFPEQIEAMSKKMPYPFVISLEKEKPLGSGGGLKHAEKHLKNEAFIAMNADNAIIPTSEQLLLNLWKFHQNAKDPLATLLTINDARVGKEFNGVWFDSKNELQEITKQPSDKSLVGYHFTGVAVYSTRIFRYLPEGESGIFSDTVAAAIKSGERILRYQEDLNWFETGDSSNYLASTKSLLTNFEKLPILKDIIKKFAPDSRYVSGETPQLISQSARISNDIKAKGFLVVGQNAEIQSNCSFENCVVLRGAQCVAGSTFKNQIIS